MMRVGFFSSHDKLVIVLQVCGFSNVSSIIMFRGVSWFGWHFRQDGVGWDRVTTPVARHSDTN